MRTGRWLRRGSVVTHLPTPLSDFALGAIGRAGQRAWPRQAGFETLRAGRLNPGHVPRSPRHAHPDSLAKSA